MARPEEKRSRPEAVPLRKKRWSWSRAFIGALIGTAFVGGLIAVGELAGNDAIRNEGDVFGAVTFTIFGGLMGVLMGGMWHKLGSPHHGSG